MIPPNFRSVIKSCHACVHKRIIGGISFFCWKHSYIHIRSDGLHICDDFQEEDRNDP